jgi:hypothetical protein
LNTSWERWGKHGEGKKCFGIGDSTAVFGREIKFFLLVIPLPPVALYNGLESVNATP